MSLPIIPEEAHRYSITQLVADLARQAGFDGVAYRSALGEGENICVFTPTDLQFEKGSEEVVNVSGLRYSTKSATTPFNPQDIWWDEDKDIPWNDETH